MTTAQTKPLKEFTVTYKGITQKVLAKNTKSAIVEVIRRSFIKPL